MKVKPFNDGVCRVYTVEKRTISEELGIFDFREETVGIQAFTEFSAIGIEVEKVISIPFNTIVNVGRVVKLNDDDNYYLISLIQKKDTFPISLRLTLSKNSLRWDENEKV